MYIVQNVTPHEIALGDLRATLRPNQKIDLDMICSRYVAEQSNCLKMALKKGAIRIIRKDDLLTISSPPSPIIGQKETSSLVTKDELLNMEKRMTDSISAQLRKITATKNDQPVVDPEALSALGPLVEQLAKLVGPKTIETKKQVEAEEDVVDEGMVDIHTRSLNRMNKKVEGKISHSEEVNKSDIQNNANELGDLM